MAPVETERWVDIPGWEGYYQASNLGRIRGLDRVVPHERFGSRLIRGRVLSPAVNSSNRLALGLVRGGRKRTYLVHQLVALAFIGPYPSGTEICHNDGNQFNNRPDNLRYDTRSANMLDRVAHGTHQMARKTHCKRGHLLGGENLRITRNSNGSKCRTCVTCTNFNKRARRARAKAEGRRVA